MTPAERENLVRRLSTQLEEQLREGVVGATESILRSHPAISSDLEAALDLIYVEITTREEMGQRVEVQELGERFPDWVERIDRLLAVHQAFGTSQQDTDQAATDHRDTQRSMFDTDIDFSRSRPDRAPTHIEQYEIQDELGRGGMGVVYKALQPELNRTVAIKVIRDALGSGESGQRLIHEAKTVARLNHPQIVRVYDAGNSDGLPFVSLEFVDGGNLGEKLSLATLDATSACSMLKMLADAVEYAHGQGVVHRDLKPANILLDAEGQPKIADFGLAKIVREQASQASAERLTDSGAILGSLCYMAPEQIRGRDAEVGPQTDIYGLGAILYESLVGRPPFLRESPVETAQDILNCPPVSPRTLVPKIPRDVETICLKCLEKNPQKRFASAAELREDLGRFLTGQPIHSRPVSSLTRGWQWIKRKPTQAALLGCVIGVPMTYGIVQREHASELLAINSRLDRTLQNETKARTQADNRFWIAFDAVAQVQGKLAGAGLEHEPRMQQTQLEIVDQALEIITNLDSERPNEVRIAKERGTLLKLRGQILMRLGKYESALEAFVQSEAIYQPLIESSSGDDQIRHGLAAATAGRAATLRRLMRDEESCEAYATATSELRRLADLRPNDQTVQVDFEQALCSWADVLVRLSRTYEAEALLSEGLQRSAVSVERWPEESRTHSVYGQTLRKMGRVAQAKDDPEAAQVLLAEATASFERALEISPGDRTYQNFIVEATMFEAELLQRLHKYEAARLPLRRAERLIIDLQGRYPSIRYYRDGRIAVLRAQSFLEMDLGNEVLAVELAEKELEQRRAIVELNPDDHAAVAEFAVSLCMHANRLVLAESLGDERYALAEAQVTEALSAIEQQPDIAGISKQQICRLAYYNLALVLARQGRASEQREALQQLKRFTMQHPIELRFLADAWSECLAMHLRIDSSQEQIQEAEEHTLAALEDAVDAGFSDREELSTQPLHKPLLGNPRFEQLLEQLKKNESPASIDST